MDTSKLQEVTAKLQQDSELQVMGNTVSVKGQKSASGTLSHNGQKFLLIVAGQQIELGENFDSVSIGIMKKHLTMQRALGI